MSTSKQIAANRRNALKSTGPRTLLGKRRSSRNALKHGRFCSPPQLRRLQLQVAVLSMVRHTLEKSVMEDFVKNRLSPVETRALLKYIQNELSYSH